MRRTTKAIVSHSSMGREDYRKAQLGLIKSCVNAEWDGGYHMSSTDGYCDRYLGVPIRLGSWPVTERWGVSWQQADMPYQFKVFAIQAAREAGYEQVIWADSTVRMLKNPAPLLEIAKERGVVAWDNLGFPLLNWINDTALNRLGENMESIASIKQIMACCIIFDFTNPMAVAVFERWSQAAFDNTFRNDETYRDDFKGHRHDQAAISVILHRYGVPLLEYGEGFCYQEAYGGPLTEGKEIFLMNKGID